MTDPILVCPFEERILSRFRNRTLAVSTDEAGSIIRIKELVEKHNRLHCIQLISAVPLIQLDFPQEMKGIPIAVFVPEVGDLGSLFEKLPLLQQLTILVYLPAEKKRNCRDARILSSLGIATALVLDDSPIDWDVLEDLLSYYAFGKIRHALIEPFNYVISNYVRNAFVDFGPVYFDNPSRYLHISVDGRISLRPKDLREGSSIGNVDSIDSIGENPRYQDDRDRVERFFLEEEGCAYCRAFRVCLGKYRSVSRENAGCEKLFGKLMDIAENSKKNESIVLWQP
jgi:hypothetical protein